MQVINYKDEYYPHFQSIGNASQFAIPYAKHVCKGFGYDVGCMKKEWSFPGSYPIDINFDDPWEANNLPSEEPNYIFSSHCLEHVDNWVDTMNYWYSRLNGAGTLFLYLPDYSQKYWRPWNNRKHKHIFTPEIIHDYMNDRNYKNIFVSGVDLNNSFMVIGEK
jgi:predicted SAM-dependent methyltransferase